MPFLTDVKHFDYIRRPHTQTRFVKDLISGRRVVRHIAAMSQHTTVRHDGAMTLSVSLLWPTSLLYIDSFPKGTPFEEGAGADESKFSKAVKAADKLGERIARTTDKIMEMRQDIDGKQVTLLGSVRDVDVEDIYNKQRRSLVQQRQEIKLQTMPWRYYWAHSESLRGVRVWH